MAFQPINFIREPQGYGPGDLLGGLLQGYEASQRPRQMREEQEQRRAMIEKLLLGNQRETTEQEFLRPSLEHKQRAGEIEEAIKQRELQYPGLKSGVPAAVLMDLARLQEEMPQGHEKGSSSPHAQSLKNLASRMMEGMEADIERKKQIVASNDWKNMTEEQRKFVAGQAHALGINPSEFAKGISEGKNLYDIAKDHGLSKDKVDSVRSKHLPTASTVSRIQRLAALNAERHVLEDRTTAAMAPYAQKINGHSPKLIVEQLKGENPEGQAEYLAARALLPDVQGVRWSALGGPMGIRAVQLLLDKGLAQAKVFEPLVTPEVYTLMNEKIAQWLNEAYEQAQGVMLDGGMSIEDFDQHRANRMAEKLLEQTRKPGGTEAKVPALLNGEEYLIPTNEVDEFLKQKGSRLK